MDEITQQTSYELQCPFEILIFTVAYSTAMPTQPDDVYLGQQILAEYARVGVEKVCEGYETLKLDISGDDGE